MLIDKDLLTRYLDALHTQYQLHGDYSISPRKSLEAPTIEQIGLIREAHHNIIPLVRLALKGLEDGLPHTNTP